MRIIGFIFTLCACLASFIFCCYLTATASTHTQADISTSVPVAFVEGVQKRIKFARGRSSAVVNNAVLRGDIDMYIVGAKAGQTMKVKITSVEDNARIQITKPRQKGLLPGAGFDEDITEWSQKLTETGDYLIEVAPTRGNATYRLTVEIR